MASIKHKDAGLQIANLIAADPLAINVLADALATRVVARASTSIIDLTTPGTFHYANGTGSISFTATNIPAAATTDFPFYAWITHTFDGTETIGFSADFDPELVAKIPTTPEAGEYRIAVVRNQGTNLLDVLMDSIPEPESAPIAPSGLTVSNPTDDTLDITWVDNSNNEDGFQLERSLDGTTGWTIVTTTAAGVTTFTDGSVTALNDGTEYFYRVLATNATAGNSGYSNVDSGTTTGTPPGINAVTDLSSGIVTMSTIQWLWTDVNTAPNEDDYTLELSTDNFATTAFTFTVPADDTEFTATGLANGQLYQARIIANSAANGNSPASNTATGTTLASSIVIVQDQFTAADPTIGSRTVVDADGVINTSNASDELEFDVDLLPVNSITRTTHYLEYGQASATGVAVIQNTVFAATNTATDGFAFFTALNVDNDNRLQIQTNGLDERAYRVIVRIGGVNIFDSNSDITANNRFVTAFPTHRAVIDAAAGTIRPEWLDNGFWRLIFPTFSGGLMTNGVISVTTAQANTLISGLPRISISNAATATNNTNARFDNFFVTNGNYSSQTPEGL